MFSDEKTLGVKQEYVHAYAIATKAFPVCTYSWPNSICYPTYATPASDLGATTESKEHQTSEQKENALA
jgi:hypothetical protein